MEKNIEIIEKFIANELDGEQLVWFQNQLRSNREFVKQYQLHIDINEAIKENDIVQLRDKLDSIYNQYIKDKKKVIHFNLYNKLAIAASILIIIGITCIYLLTNKSLSNQELFAQYYEPYETVVNHRSGDDYEEILFAKAFNLYENKLYNEALVYFNQILETQPDNTFILFYTAISEIETEQTEAAIEKFKQIIDNKNDVLYQQSKWYLALCYLKADKANEAILIFNEIIDNNFYCKTEAEKILRQIKKT